MHTEQIATAILDNYRRDRLSDERVDFLKTQAHEQLAEIASDKALFLRLTHNIDDQEKLDELILWMLIMSDEENVEAYIDAFGKPFRELIPISDLADLLLYAIHLKKVVGVELDGYDYLLQNYHEGKDEVDHYCFTNVLLYVQKSKEASVSF